MRVAIIYYSKGGRGKGKGEREEEGEGEGEEEHTPFSFIHSHFPLFHPTTRIFTPSLSLTHSSVSILSPPLSSSFLSALPSSVSWQDR